MVCGAKSDDGEEHLAYIGVVLCAFGSIALNFGNNIQSLALQGRHSDVKKSTDVGNVSKTEDCNGEKHVVNKPLFYTGTAIFVTGSLTTFAAFAFAAQSMLAPIEAVQFVSNVIFAKFVHGVQPSWRTVIGTVLIVGGAVMTVVFSPHATVTCSIPQIQRLYEAPAYQSYIVIAAAGAFVLDFAYKAFEKKKKKGNPWSGTEKFLPLSYALFSAIFGTQMVVQAKVLSMVIMLTLDGDNQFKFWFMWVTLAMWLLFLYIWLARMASALAKFNPLFIIPVLQVFFILLAVIAGGIFFQEFNAFTVENWIGFVSGVLIVFFGLYLIAPRDDSYVGVAHENHSSTKADSEDRDEEEKKIEDELGIQNDTEKWAAVRCSSPGVGGGLNLNDLYHNIREFSEVTQEIVTEAITELSDNIHHAPDALGRELKLIGEVTKQITSGKIDEATLQSMLPTTHLANQEVVMEAICHHQPAQEDGPFVSNWRTRLSSRHIPLPLRSSPPPSSPELDNSIPRIPSNDKLLALEERSSTSAASRPLVGLPSAAESESSEVEVSTMPIPAELQPSTPGPRIPPRTPVLLKKPC